MQNFSQIDEVLWPRPFNITRILQIMTLKLQTIMFGLFTGLGLYLPQRSCLDFLLSKRLPLMADSRVLLVASEFGSRVKVFGLVFTRELKVATRILELEARIT